MENFAENLLNDLHRYLVDRGAVDQRLPECPDVEEKWPAVAEAYLPDGAREFNLYPIASLGWMMFIGMAIAKFWDTDWEKYAQIGDLYTPLRDKRGYDHLDEYVMEEVLDLHGDDAEAMQNLVGDLPSAPCLPRISSLALPMPSRATLPACSACISWAWPCSSRPWDIIWRGFRLFRL